MSGDDGRCPSACSRRVAGGAHPPRPRLTCPGTSIREFWQIYCYDRVASTEVVCEFGVDVRDVVR
jgi:hypothetical protein